VAHAFFANCSADTGNPKLAEVPLLCFPVAVCIGKALGDCVLGCAEQGASSPPVSLCKFEDLLAAVFAACAVNCSWHLLLLHFPRGKTDFRSFGSQLASDSVPRFGVSFNRRGEVFVPV